MHQVVAVLKARMKFKYEAEKWLWASNAAKSFIQVAVQMKNDEVKRVSQINLILVILTCFWIYSSEPEAYSTAHLQTEKTESFVSYI